MEEDGRRWKKMEEDGRKKKFEKSREKKDQKKDCLESAGDGLGTLIGVQIAQKIFWSLGYEKKISESHGSVTDRFVLILLSFLKHF